MLLDAATTYTRDMLSVMDILQHPIWIFDFERQQMYWANRAALEVWNAPSLVALLERDFQSDTSESIQNRLLYHIESIQKGESIRELWTYYPPGSQTSKTLEMTASGVRIDDGRVAVLAEAQVPGSNNLNESTKREIGLIRHLPVPVRQFSLQGELQSQNPEAASCYGAVPRPSPRDFIDSFADPKVGKECLSLLQNGNRFDRETEMRSVDGVQWHSMSARRVQDPAKSGYRIVCTTKNISHIAQAQKDTAMLAAKSDLIDMLAHEIRTPLHQIVGWSDLLSESSLTEIQQNGHIKLVQKSAAALLDIANDLIESSNFENGQIQIKRVSFDLDTMLYGCITTVAPQAQEKGLESSCKIPPGFKNATVVGDPNRIRQVCLNVLSNAIKFTEQGNITLKVGAISSAEANLDGDLTCDKHVSSGIRFEVIDTGIGIEEAEQEQVFVKWFRSNNTPATTWSGGMGLGLAIARGLVQAMDGRIGLRSKVGSGTTVWFELPLEFAKAKDEETVDHKQSISQSEPGLASGLKDKSLRILVVEDIEINQKLLAAMLKRLGHAVVIAENGKVGLDHVHCHDDGHDDAQSECFDLVLMDVQMPVMNGIQSTKEIRKLYDKRSLPIIGLTAGFTSEQLPFFQDIGMNTCVAKPVTFKHLKDLLISAIEMAEEELAAL